MVRPARNTPDNSKVAENTEMNKLFLILVIISIIELVAIGISYQLSEYESTPISYSIMYDYKEDAEIFLRYCILKMRYDNGKFDSVFQIPGVLIFSYYPKTGSLIAFNKFKQDWEKIGQQDK